MIIGGTLSSSLNVIWFRIRDILEALSIRMIPKLFIHTSELCELLKFI